MSYPATVTVFNSPGTMPFVLVSYPNVAPGTVVLRIDQTAEGRTRKVRGGIGIPPNTPRPVYEVPFNTEVTYRAEMFSNASMAEGTSLGYTEAVTVTVACDTTWIHQPLSPTLAVAVQIDESTAEEIIRPVPGDLVWAAAATLPRWVGKRRRGIVGMPFVMETSTQADANALQAMLGGYSDDDRQIPVLCVRTPGPAPRIPRLLFVTFDTALVEQGVSVNMGGSIIRWPTRITETLPPTPGLASSTLTYADIDAAYASYALSDSAYASYTAKDSDYSLAGTAP